MPLESDLKLNGSKFDPNNVTQKTKDFNDGLMKIMNNGPKWYSMSTP